MDTYFVFDSIYHELGLTRTNQNPYKCGTFYIGDGIRSTGKLWQYTYEDQFAVTICDFMVLQDLAVTMPPEEYLGLRWDLTQNPLSGKIVSFLEEKGQQAHITQQHGSKVCYIEILYQPPFYKAFLPQLFQNEGMNSNPATILRTVSRDTHWPSSVFQLFQQVKEYEGTGNEAKLYYIAKCFELMSLILQINIERSSLKDCDILSMQAVKEYIDTNFQNAVRQATLTEIAHMSATKLKNIFKKYTGKTITDYILEKKIQIAQELLSDPELSIEEIAMCCGFETSTGFATSFRKKTNQTPSAFRKAMAIKCVKNPSAIRNLEL